MIQKKINLHAYEILKKFDNKIFNSSLEDFIAFAKNYNIFQESQNKLYLQNVEKIKQRLQQENLSIDFIKPE